MPAPVLTPREAARRLGIGYSTLKQWIYQGSVRTTRTRGGHHRIQETEVERLLAGGDAPTPPPARRRSSASSPAVVALSPRNQLPGIIEEVRTDGLLAQVRLRVGDYVITAVITKDAVESLRLRRGQPAIALIKSTEVMIGCEPRDERQAPRRRPSRPVESARRGRPRARS
jgi:molybdopterin-binding protein